MALIKCEECGQMYSDKAERCPHCGAPAIKKTVCEECGSVLEPTDKVCPSCGCPVKGKRQEAPTSDSEGNEKKVQRFLVENRKNLPQNKLDEIRTQLSALNPKQWDIIECSVFKDLTTMLLISIFIGYFGVDRFMLGDTKNGIIKLLLTLCCGVGLIWWIIDIFKINEMTLNYNYKQLKETLKYV